MFFYILFSYKEVEAISESRKKEITVKYDGLIV